MGIPEQPFMLVNCHSAVTEEQFQLPDGFSVVSYTDRKLPLRVKDALRAISDIMFWGGRQIPAQVGPYSIKITSSDTVPNYRCEGDDRYKTAMFAVPGFQPRVTISDGACYRLKDLVDIARETTKILVMLSCKTLPGVGGKVEVFGAGQHSCK